MPQKVESLDEITIKKHKLSLAVIVHAAYMKELLGMQSAQPMMALVRPEVAKLKPTPVGEVIAKDGDFIKYSNGIVYDEKTGLEWYAGADEDINWARANIWATGLEVGGGNWRLPAVKEIQTLYDKGKGTRNMSPLLNITGWSAWSKEDADSGIANVNRRLSYYFRGRGRVQDQVDLNPCRPA